jgi:hypothetical protein
MLFDRGVTMNDNSILMNDLRLSWKHAVRCCNYCENAGLKDSYAAIAEIVVKLSQQLEYTETMK